jgi:hypothetical protein
MGDALLSSATKFVGFLEFCSPSDAAALQQVLHVTSPVSLLTVASHGAPLRPPEEVSEKTARFV